MSCSRHRRYCVLSLDEQYFVGKTSDGWYDWYPNNDRNFPWLFRSVKDARKCADDMNGKVRWWPGKLPKKSLRYNDARR